MTTRAAKASLLLVLLYSALSPGMVGQQPKSAVERYLAAARQAEHAGNFLEAEKLYLAAVQEAKQSNDPRLGRVLDNLANIYARKGEETKAIECMKQALAVDETTLGAGHARVAMDLNHLAMLYGPSDQAQAEKCYKRALDIMDNLPEQQDSGRLTIINNLSQFYMSQHHNAESEALLKSAVETLANSPQPKGLELGNMRHLLATVYEDEGKESDAEVLEDEAAEALQPTENPQFDPVFITMCRADRYRSSGKLEAAEADYHEVISALEMARGDKTRRQAYPSFLPSALDGLGELYVAEARNAEAEDLFKRAFDLRVQYASSSKQGISFVRSLRFPIHLFNLYQSEGRLAEMEPVYERALAVEEKVLGPQDPSVGETLLRFARLYLAEGKNQDAAPLYQRALEIQEKNEGETVRLVAALEDYAHLLQNLGEEDEAAAVRSRAKAINTRIAAENKKP